MHIMTYGGVTSGKECFNGKESACQCRRGRRHGLDHQVRKIHWSRKWQHTPVFLPEKFHGQRSLVGYSLWGSKESDMTEQLNTQTNVMHTQKIKEEEITQCV